MVCVCVCGGGAGVSAQDGGQWSVCVGKDGLGPLVLMYSV